MKKILGLDLGSASIGWAVIIEDETNRTSQSRILGLGSRIIPYEGTEGISCPKGILERFYILIGDTVIAMCPDINNCKEIYKKLLNVKPYI